MSDPPRRSTATYLVASLLVVVVCLGAATLTWQLRDDDDESRPAVDGYTSVGVPWWSGQAVHWAGHSTPQRGEIAVFTASQDAAVYLHDRLGYDDGTVPEPYLGTLTALFSDGTSEQLAEDVVGVPMADPNGHVVAWAVEVDADTVAVTAYDTSDRVELGSQRVDLDDDGSIGLTAVVGDTVYLRSGRQALSWDPRDGDDPPEVVPGTDTLHTVIGGAADGLLVLGPEFHAFWLGRDGTRVNVDPALGSLSPDGRFVAASEDEHEDAQRVVAVLSGENVDLDLPADVLAYRTRWAADGTLVVAAVSRAALEDGWDDAHEVTSYACDVEAGECRLLEGGPQAIYHLPLYEGSFLGQFFIAYEGQLS